MTDNTPPNTEQPTVAPTEAPTLAPNTDINSLVEAETAKRLVDIKASLDRAYAARDEALRKAAEYEAKQREEELNRLKEEGKHKEAYELMLAEEKAAREAAENKVTQLTRDLELKQALTAHPFKTSKAEDFAYREIVGDLIKDEKGAWVHKSGKSIKDAVKDFVDDESNAFLLKPQVSSGGGSSTVQPPSTSTKTKKSLFEMPQSEVIKMVQEGKLRK